MNDLAWLVVAVSAAYCAYTYAKIRTQNKYIDEINEANLEIAKLKLLAKMRGE